MIAIPSLSKTARRAAAVLLLPLLTACQASLVGDWHLSHVTPNREAFCLEDVQFDREGGFAATVTLDGRTARETGTYDFSGFHLTLRPAAGGQRRYDAQLKVNRLDVRRGSTLVVLERGKSHNAEPPPKPRSADEPSAKASEERAPDPPSVIHEGSPPQP